MLAYFGGKYYVKCSTMLCIFCLSWEKKCVESDAIEWCKYYVLFTHQYSKQHYHRTGFNCENLIIYSSVKSIIHTVAEIVADRCLTLFTYLLLYA